LLAAAAPVLLHYVGHTADGVEDVTSLLPLSVTQTETVVERAWEAIALEMSIAVWAMMRRELPLTDLGAAPRLIYQTLQPLLRIGEEGRRVFDMRRIVETVRSGRLVEQCLSMAAGE
jgi:histidine ammonia-lyase